jgi:elongation factor Tu
VADSLLLAILGPGKPLTLTRPAGRRVYAHDLPLPFSDRVAALRRLLSDPADGVLLVREAGLPLPDWTAEGLRILWYRGHRHAVILLVGDGDREAAERDARLVLAHAGFPADDLPVVAGDPADPGVAETLLDACDATFPGREVGGPFYLPIEDTVFIPGRGCVVVGLVVCGVVSVGEDAEVLRPPGNPLLTQVVGIERFSAVLSRAVAGEDVGVLLRGVASSDLAGAWALATPGSVVPADVFEVLMLLDSIPAGAGLLEGDSVTLARPGGRGIAARLTRIRPLGPGGDEGLCLPGGLCRCRVKLDGPALPFVPGMAFPFQAGGRPLGVAAVLAGE